MSIFPTHFLSRNLVLNSEFQNSIISGSFPKFLGFRKWLFFGQFQHLGHYFHSILVKELDFQLRFFKKIIILESSQNFRDIGTKFWEDSRIIIFFKIWVENQVCWLKLSGNDTPYVEIGRKTVISQRFPETLKISGNFKKSLNF